MLIPLSASLSSASSLAAALTIDEYGYLCLTIEDEIREVQIDGLEASEEVEIENEFREVIISPEIVT